ncbi:MAG: hypothetical protein Kow00121_21430 [Elainellaceae cyanobacterium]
MRNLFYWSLAGSALLGAGAIISVALSPPIAVAQQNESAFPDVQPDYWAYPFIQQLAERDIITGYLDGTFRPERPIQRDEFAAMVRQAFNFDQERQIESASNAFADVPQGYWASNAIEEAYQTGVMNASEENLFRPEENIAKLDAVLALSDEIDLASETGEPETVAALPARRTEQARERGKVPNQLAFPLATTALMAPIFNVVSPAGPQPAEPASEPVAEAPAEPAEEPIAAAPTDLSTYYVDADQIPEERREVIQAATEAGIIVNYPDPQQFAPNQLLLRSGATALIHQALVEQGRIDPLPEDSPAQQYTVTPEGNQ